MRNVFFYAWQALKEDSLMFVNFGHLAEDKARPFKLACDLVNAGWTLQETFVWVKNHYKPIQGRRRVNNLTEFIFMFSKGNMPELDRLAVGIPYADKSNIGRYAVSDLKCAGNVWNIAYDTIQSSEDKLHNDRFPLDLPLRCLKLAGIKPRQLVCDPFAGSGTTALACKQLGLNYVGWEINQTHYETALKRVQS
jgi:site-specific DNA-methyltransferase (adenine-specific)